MKKIFTLAFGLLMTAMLFAADRRPSVLLTSSRNFEVVIDGRSFVTNGRTISLDRIGNGRHSIQVYEMRRGFFGTQRRAISQSTFRVKNNDMMIRVAQDGQIIIRERDDRYGYNNGRDNRRGNGYGYNNGRNDNGYGRDRDFDRNGNQRDDRNWDDNDERDWNNFLQHK